MCGLSVSAGNLLFLFFRQVQKLDRINSDRQSGSDQLRSTHEKNIKLNEIETFIHLKVKIPVKSGPIKKDSRRFSVSCRVVKPPFCILSASPSQTRLVFIVHPSLIPPRRPRQSWTQMKVKSRPSFSLNWHPSTKLVVSTSLLQCTITSP